MKQTFRFVIYLCIVILLLAACQEQAPAEPFSTQTSCDRWAGQFQIGNTQGIVDAAITASPEATGDVFVVKKRHFLPTEIEAFLRAFAPELREMRSYIRTKEELQEELAQIQNSSAPGIKATISAIESEMLRSPEKAVYHELEPINTLPIDLEYRSDQETVRISADEQFFSIRLGNTLPIVQEEVWEFNGIDPSLTPECSENYAEEKALEALELLGSEDLGIAAIEKAVIVDYTLDNHAAEVGWEITLARTDGNRAPINQDKLELLSYDPKTTPSKSAPWFTEYMKLYVGNDGVRDISWHSPLEIVEVLNTGRILLPVERITAYLQEHLQSAISAEEAQGYDYEITALILSSALTASEKGAEYGELVPAWFLIYTRQQDGEAEPYRMLYTLCINAFDGSVINPFVMGTK